MKRILAAAAASTLAACAGTDIETVGTTFNTMSFGYAGLTFDETTDSFSGLPLTAAADLPVTADARYRGRYRGKVPGDPIGGGTARLKVNFISGAAQLSTSGMYIGKVQGQVVGNRIESGNGGLSGQFYGAGGEVAGGTFNGVIVNTTKPITGRYIVELQ